MLKVREDPYIYFKEIQTKGDKKAFFLMSQSDFDGTTVQLAGFDGSLANLDQILIKYI